jgi:hypothetical protein
MEQVVRLPTRKESALKPLYVMINSITGRHPKPRPHCRISMATPTNSQGGCTAIRRAIRKPLIAAGKSAAARAAVIATTMKIAVMRARATTKAGSPARARVTMTTMTTGVAAAGMSAGTATPRATPKRRAAVEGKLRST